MIEIIRQLRRAGGLVVVASLGLLAATCSTSSTEPPKGRGTDMANDMVIKSSAFEAGKAIPKKYTGEGADVSPPLAWSGVPQAARELALIVDDPDAPRPQPWVHWVVYRIPVAASGLPEAVLAGERVKEPAGAIQGLTTAGQAGYHGPMPPKGHGVHHYHFKLYALDQALDLKPGLDKDGLLKAMKGHILGQAELVGTYERK